MSSWTSGGLASGQFNFIYAAILLIGCSVLQAAYAQSFDCSKASTSIEHAICEDKRLGDEDEALARELKAAMAAMPERRQLLLEDQRWWLGYRDYRCRGESSLKDCLGSLYSQRVGHLQASASPSAAMCRKVADGYRPAASAEPGRAGSKVLVNAHPLKSVSGETLAWSDDLIPQLREHGKAQEPPFVVSQELVDALDLLAEDTGTIGTLAKMPGRSIYSMTHEQGSAHCLTSQFFAVQNGEARPLPAPAILEEINWESCEAYRGFQVIDGTPALVQNRFDRSPSMIGTQVIVTWDDNLSASGCALTFTFAPKFGRAAYSFAEETCEGALCDALRAAARELVESVQRDPKRTRARLLKQLTQEQRAEYDAAVEPLIRARGDSYEDHPDSITDFAPLLLPYVHEEQLYIVSVGHFKPYGFIFADWSVKFQAPMAGKLKHAATFAVGMERGELEDLSISLGPGR